MVNRSAQTVTVVTPAFNAAATIAACCDSVRTQDYGQFDHVVVDAASTDSTRDIALSKGATVHTAPDSGIFDGMSKGVQLATGNYVHILNADDRYADANVLTRVIAEMVARDLDVCHGKAAQLSPSGQLVRVVGRDLDKRTLLKKMRVAHPTVVVRREVYERYGAFSVGFRIAGDYEFLLRIWDRVRVGFIDDVLIHMAVGGNSNRPENLVRAYRESMACAVLHGAHPFPATARCAYEIAKHRIFFARAYQQP